MMEPEISQDAFHQGFRYQVGTGKEAKGVFAKSQKAILQHENRKEEDTVESLTQREKLRSRLHLKTQRGGEAQTQQIQNDLIEGNLDPLKNLFSSKLPPALAQSKGKVKGKTKHQLNSLLQTMSEMKTFITEAKAAGLVQPEPIESKIKPMKSRPFEDPEVENERMVKLSKNQRKRQKAKAKRKVIPSSVSVGSCTPKDIPEEPIDSPDPTSTNP